MDRDAHQILVHAGARASRKDDERYAHQARAYLELDENLFTRVTRHEADLPTNTSPIQAAFEHPPAQTSPIASWQQSTLIEDTQLAYAELRSQLPTSSAPARVSVPKLSRAAQIDSTQKGGKTTFSAAKRRHSSGSDYSQSSYFVTPLLHRSKRPCIQAAEESPTRRQTREDRGRLASQTTSPAVADAQKGSSSKGDEGHSGSHEVNSYETTSELPTTYSLSDLASGSSKERPQPIERSTSDPGPQLRKTINESAQRNKGPNDTSKANVHGAAGEAPISGRESQRSFGLHLSEGDRATLRTLPIEIRPPAPKTDVAHFTTHVTQALAYLANESPAANCFHPLWTSREIETWDRGHWRFDCSSWPVARRVAFWRMLENAVGSGTAGSDVWCTRGSEIQVSEHSNSEDADFVDSNSHESFGLIRVYCWGEIVRHVYILLYVASSSKVRHLGLQWLDAERKVVVQMPREGSNGSKQ